MVSRRERDFLLQGENPDPRFTLANERTFLAWIRTALALMAGGIGIDAFLEEIPSAPRRALSAALLVLGGVLAMSSYRRWRAAEHALRTGQPLPLPGTAILLSIGVTATAAVLLLFVLFVG
jgi:putative membrane protein